MLACLVVAFAVPTEASTADVRTEVLGLQLVRGGVAGAPGSIAAPVAIADGVAATPAAVLDAVVAADPTPPSAPVAGPAQPAVAVPLAPPPAPAAPPAAPPPAPAGAPEATAPEPAGPAPAAPEPAVPAGVELATGSARLDGVGLAGLERIAYPWAQRFPGWRIVFLPARAGLRGLTVPDERAVRIYVRATDTPASVARVLAHELGHVADLALLGDGGRSRWRAARAAPASVPWWPSPEANDFATLAGDFAEAFAVWQVGVTSQSTVGPQPGPDELAVLASLVG